MTTKHTPGEWLADEFGLDIENACECLRDGKGTEREWTAVSVAFGPDDPQGEGFEHVAYCHPDNVPIIAAAPEMHTALKSVSDIFRVMTDYGLFDELAAYIHPDQINAACDAVSSAIEKAEAIST